MIMKYRFKRLWVEWKDVVLMGVGLTLVFGIFAWSLWSLHNTEKNNPMDPTSEKGIEARSFEYKGHKYLLFEKTNVFGPISVVHDPDCCK